MDRSCGTLRGSEMKNTFPAVRLHGALGNALQTVVTNRLKKVDYRLLESPFINRNEADNGWRCEFWGKIVRSAILANNSVRDPELEAIIRETVKNIMATQTPDGCISSYPADKQTTFWDLWGRKYVIQALLRYYYMVEEDAKVKECCVKMLDHLMTQVNKVKKDIRECGLHNGLASASILGAVVGVYKLTGEERFLDYASYIAGSGCSGIHDVFKAARNGVAPQTIGNAKSYELTSCFQGLAELYKLDMQAEYKEACEKYFHAVREKEIFITGVGGLRDCCGEYWYDGKFRQTRSDSGMLGETCVTTTYLHYCDVIANLIDPAIPMAEAECSLYNGILGAMSPDGTQWIHCNPTPLTGGGWKNPADDQINRGFGTPFGGNDCCLAQGPEALAMAPKLAVTARKDGAALNFFEALTAELADGTKIEVSGDYPASPQAEISVCSPREFCLYLRIPEFCTGVTLNGTACKFNKGEYLAINRQWSADDRLLMTFDFSLKEVAAPDGSDYTAVVRGPLVMAEGTASAGYIACEKWRDKELIDYASAGRKMSENDPLTVWFCNK